MVYYGALSKGCERCRQRKVKCDQRKPACLRCEKSGTQCPGFRDLGNVMFRDESARTVQRARAAHGDAKHAQLETLPSVRVQGSARSPLRPQLPATLAPPPSHTAAELGANFFFANYSCHGPHISDGCGAWLSQIYFGDHPKPALQAVVEATGMAGLANISSAPQLAAISKKRYGQAIQALKQALEDPVESVSDTTVMTVLLFGLFEFVTFHSGDHYRSWRAHIDGALTILSLRERQQFSTVHGANFFIQLRSQFLYYCIQQDIPPPAALVRLNRRFQASIMGQRRKMARPPPLGDLCFRLMNIKASLAQGENVDFRSVRDAAMDMEEELQVWLAAIKSSWNYKTCQEDAGSKRACFEGTYHVYNSVVAAQCLNNWRTLRILVARILLRSETELAKASSRESAAVATAAAVIQQMATDVCISVSSFAASPHMVSLIWPLSVVAREPLATNTTRLWVVEQMRGIHRDMGFRQAVLIADAIERELIESRRTSAEMSGHNPSNPRAVDN